MKRMLPIEITDKQLDYHDATQDLSQIEPHPIHNRFMILLGTRKKSSERFGPSKWQQRNWLPVKLNQNCPKWSFPRGWVNQHDDVIKWKHFPRYWPFVRGIQLSPVNSPHKGQWRRALMFSLIWVRINGWVNNRETSDLRHYSAHYDVIVMRSLRIADPLGQDRLWNRVLTRDQSGSLRITSTRWVGQFEALGQSTVWYIVIVSSEY